MFGFNIYISIITHKIIQSIPNPTMRPIPQVNYESHPDQQQDSHQPDSHYQNESATNKQNIQYFGIAAFAILITVIVVFKIFTGYDEDVENGRFYANQVMSLDLIKEWQLTQEKMKEEQGDAAMRIIDDDKPHAISREQLGRQSWALLHMMTGAFPQNFDDKLRKKFNTFLVLFGQMYPCKMCANHFMQLLKKQGLFTGHTKKQLMIYLCNIHNKVNERLGHPIHDCSTVPQQWNTCGCTGQPNTL